MATPFLTLAAEHGVQWPLATRRLELRPFTAENTEAAWAYWSLPATTQWTRERIPSAGYLAERWLNSGGRLLACLPGGEVVGDVGVTIADAFAHLELADGARDKEAELNWALNPEHQGAGYGTEMVAAVMDLLFTRLGLHRIEARCFAFNEPSWRLMERLGMRRETHRVKSGRHRDFGWVDAYIYAILEEEWGV